MRLPLLAVTLACTLPAQLSTPTSLIGTIDGTVQFASSAGLPIAPVVVRLAGNSVSTFQVARPFTAPVE